MSLKNKLPVGDERAVLNAAVHTNDLMRGNGEQENDRFSFHYILFYIAIATGMLTLLPMSVAFNQTQLIIITCSFLTAQNRNCNHPLRQPVSSTLITVALWIQPSVTSPNGKFTSLFLLFTIHFTTTGELPLAFGFENWHPNWNNFVF